MPRNDRYESESPFARTDDYYSRDPGGPRHSDRWAGNDGDSDRFRDRGSYHERGLEERRYDGMSRGVNVGKGPKNFTRSDERIREDVCELLQDSDVDASDIEVRVKDGEVTLEGTVDDRQAKRYAEEIVCRGRGVKDCHNQLRIQRRDASSEHDTRGAARTNGGGRSATSARSSDSSRASS
jgi:hypothetical protein